MTSDHFLQVLTTIDTKDGARQIARHLIEGHLAGCVQIIGPIESVYRWVGQVEVAEEWLCLIKTREDRYPEVERAIREMHPYEVPEILATPITGGIASYLAWLNESL